MLPDDFEKGRVSYRGSLWETYEYSSKEKSSFYPKKKRDYLFSDGKDSKVNSLFSKHKSYKWKSEKTKDGRSRRVRILKDEEEMKPPILDEEVKPLISNEEQEINSSMRALLDLYLRSKDRSTETSLTNRKENQNDAYRNSIYFQDILLVSIGKDYKAFLIDMRKRYLRQKRLQFFNDCEFVFRVYVPLLFGQLYIKVVKAIKRFTQVSK